MEGVRVGSNHRERARGNAHEVAIEMNHIEPRGASIEQQHKNLGAGFSPIDPTFLEALPDELRTEFVKNGNLLEQLGQECGTNLTLVTILAMGIPPKLRIDIERILDQLYHNENSCHEENNKAMVRANCYEPFVGFLCCNSGESKLAMANALAHFKLDNSQREALVQPNVNGAIVGMLKSGQFRSECAALEAL
eukprot:Gb_06196 [translate_table: standard]